MSETPAPPPTQTPGWTTAAELGARLGVTPTTIRRHLQAGASWLPAPTQIAGRYVWKTADLEGIESVDRPLVGNPTWGRRATPPPDPQP